MKIDRVITQKSLAYSLLISLVLLPSCGLLDWIKEKMGGKKGTSSGLGVNLQNDSSQPIVTMDGNPLITVNSLQAEKKELIEANPQLKTVLAFMDEKQVDRNLTDGLANQAIVDRYIAEHQVDKRIEYQQELDRMMKSMRHMLNTKFFSQELAVVVTDAEVTEFYNKNKETMPNLVVSRGGVKATGISFDKEADAQGFLKKVKELKGDLTKAAEAAGLNAKMHDFRLVNSQSIGIDSVLRDKIMNFKSFPTTELVKLQDKTFWVVSATGKEDPKYRPLETVQADIRAYIEKEKRTDLFEKEIARLKTEYKVVIQEDYFKREEAQETRQADANPENENQPRLVEDIDSDMQEAAKAA